MIFEWVGPGIAFWRALRGKGWDRWAYGIYLGPALDADDLHDWWHWRLGTIIAAIVLILMGVSPIFVLAITLLASSLDVNMARGAHFDRLDVLWLVVGPFELNLYVEDRKN